MDSDGLGICFHFGRGYYLHAEFYGLIGTSIMVLVVQESGGLSQHSSMGTGTQRMHGLTCNQNTCTYTYKIKIRKEHRLESNNVYVWIP